MVSPCTGSCSLKPSLLELFQPLTLWRKTCVTTWVVIGNSLSTVLDASSSDPREGWFLSPLLVEVRKQVDGRCWWEPPICPFKAEQQREDSGKPGDLIAYVCANCGVLGMLVFLMLRRSRKLVLWLWCALGITVIFMASEMWKRDLKTRKVTKKPSNLCVLQHALFCSFIHLSCQRNGNAAVADVFLTTLTHPGKLRELLAMLVCKSQQLSSGLSGGFWFEEALIFRLHPLSSPHPPQSSRENCSWEGDSALRYGWVSPAAPQGWSAGEDRGELWGQEGWAQDHLWSDSWNQNNRYLLLPCVFWVVVDRCWQLHFAGAWVLT